ncbi:MAG: hypothetical protein Q4D79_13145 [Propionibacteriaceae bacterium]|nr:hypothetical protein [Propionibacteriaceae bacterium]
MAGSDWNLVSAKSGEDIEWLVATLIVAEFTNARRVNPSQGDHGRDVERKIAHFRSSRFR